MAGPVFVIDAQGQPLMPLAAAHARRLLTSGKARLHPHYLLTIIQLNRTIVQPVLRPILVGIDLHRTTAELRVLADGPRTHFPLLSLIIDLAHPRIQRQHVRRRRRRVRERSRHLRTVGTVIGSLSSLLPISQVLVLRSPVLQSISPGWLRRLRRFLVRAGVQLVLAHRNTVVPPGIRADLYAAFDDFRHNPPRHIPVLVALPIGPPPRRIRLRGFLNESIVDSPYSGIGVVGASSLIGLIESSGEPVILRVPVAADRTGVTWRYVAVPPQAVLQHWPLSSAVLLPPLPRALRERMTLHENRHEVIHE